MTLNYPFNAVKKCSLCSNTLCFNCLEWIPWSTLRGCWVKESCRQCELNAELESVEARFIVAVKVVGEADEDDSKRWYKDWLPLLENNTEWNCQQSWNHNALWKHLLWHIQNFSTVTIKIFLSEILARYFLRYWRKNPRAFLYELVVGNSSGGCCLERVIARTES